MAGSSKINFTIKDGLAYTEDNVLVYKLYVFYIIGKVTSTTLKEYFSRFGKVLDAKLIINSKGIGHKPEIHGFVLFKEAAAAASALKTTQHKISSNQICSVQASSTWHQPNVATPKNLPNEIDNKDFAGLSNESLKAKCRQLGLKDRISFAMTSKRCADVFISSFKSEYKSFDISQLHFLTHWKQMLFFQLMGEHISKIEGRILLKHLVDLISEYCVNLKSLNLKDTPIQNFNVDKLFQQLKNLTELGMNCCDLTDSSIILKIEHLNKLESLSIPNNEEFTGEHIEKLQNLKCLNLQCCRGLQPMHFVKICKSLKLQELDIRNCDLLKEPEFKVLADHQNRIEVLKLSGRIYYQHIFQLPSLKFLQIHHTNDDMHNDFFNTLEQKQQLQYLKLFCTNSITNDRAKKIGYLKHLRELECPNNKELDDACLDYFIGFENLEVLNVSNTTVTDRGILKLLSMCKKLKRIEVEMCEGITDKFYHEAFEILRKRGERGDMDAKLKVNVGGSKIDGNDWKRYADSCKHFLELDFHLTNSDDLNLADDHNALYFILPNGKLEREGRVNPDFFL